MTIKYTLFCMMVIILFPAFQCRTTSNLGTYRTLSLQEPANRTELIATPLSGSDCSWFIAITGFPEVSKALKEALAKEPEAVGLKRVSVDFQYWGSNYACFHVHGIPVK